MRRHVAVQQIPETDKYPTYQRPHLPMLQAMMEKKGFAPQNSDTNTTSDVGQNVKKDMNLLLMQFGNLVVQRATPYDVLEKCRDDHVTS